MFLHSLRKMKEGNLFFLERSLFSLILRPPPSVTLRAPSFHLSGTITFDNFFSPTQAAKIHTKRFMLSTNLTDLETKPNRIRNHMVNKIDLEIIRFWWSIQFDSNTELKIWDEIRGGLTLIAHHLRRLPRDWWRNPIAQFDSTRERKLTPFFIY